MEPRGAAGTHPPAILSIAGFDPTGGAGTAADLKTFAAHSCYGVAVISAVTLQNTVGVERFEPVSAALLAGQIGAVAADVQLAGVKVGMLGTGENVEAVAAALERYAPPFVVLDPVFRSTSGTPLLEETGIEVLRARLLPKVTLVTPNMEEASRLAGRPVTSVDEMKAAAAAVFDASGARAVVTGGHLDKPQDVFYDGSQFIVFAGDRIRSENTHGTGCAFSSAIAANLALGKSLADAIVLAKAFVTQAIEKGYPLGRGQGVLNHLYRLQPAQPPRTIVMEADSHAAGHR